MAVVLGLGAVPQLGGKLEKWAIFYHCLQVLHLEQLLTTGGGWQDQCGGLYGGIKISRSLKGLPVKISTKQLELSEEILDKLNQHLLLVYTGKTRLARNLLQVALYAFWWWCWFEIIFFWQNVLRNWHSRNEKVIETMEEMIGNTVKAEEIVLKGEYKQDQC